MDIYVITGSIACGKSTVTNYIKELGYNVIDCDKIVDEIYNAGHSGYEAVKENFGMEYTTSLMVDRGKLSDHVFANDRELQKLNHIIHPLVQEEIEKRINKEVNFVDIPLYFESKEHFTFDAKVIVVYTTRDKQLKRLMNRDDIPKSRAMKIIDEQEHIDAKKEKADIVFDNTGTKEELISQVNKFLKGI